MAISECPSCTFHIPIESNMQEGDVIECPDCGAKLKLVSLMPPLFEEIKEE
ncbi:MAG: lysine biosynthesis protein LysW [Candidatus Micrarchaeota archaeon]|nr:lysine biosynthesis protein LysW [Candidatus Micrarchaeota archaeon]